MNHLAITTNTNLSRKRCVVLVSLSPKLDKTYRSIDKYGYGSPLDQSGGLLIICTNTKYGAYCDQRQTSCGDHHQISRANNVMFSITP
jgi:hypothetical protein